MLNLLIYAAEQDYNGQSLLREIVKTIQQERLIIKTFSNLDSLSARLRQPRTEPTCLVMAPTTIEELKEFALDELLLRNVKTILVIPADQEEMADFGYRLKPSYLTFSENGLWEVIAVLRRLFVRYQKDLQPDSNQDKNDHQQDDQGNLFCTADYEFGRVLH